MGSIRFTAGVESISAHEERVYFDGDSEQDVMPCVSGLRKAGIYRRGENDIV